MRVIISQLGDEVFAALIQSGTLSVPAAPLLAGGSNALEPVELGPGLVIQGGTITIDEIWLTTSAPIEALRAALPSVWVPSLDFSDSRNSSFI